MVQLPLDGEIPEACGPVAVNDFRFAAFNRPWTMPLVAQRDRHVRGARIAPHRHSDFYSLYMVRGGSGVHEINGHLYGVARGDAYLMAPGAQHVFRNYRQLETDTFHFQIALFGRDERLALQEISHLLGELFVLPASAGGRAQRGPKRRAPTAHRLHLAPGPYEDAQAKIERIRMAAARPTLLSATLARHQFFELLVFLAHNYRADNVAGQHGPTCGPIPAASREHDQSPESPSDERLAGLGRVLEYCDQNFTRGVSVADLARHLFLTTDHFSRLFTQHFGVLPGVYIRRLRVARAQELLRNTTLSVEEIALQAGFRSANRLSETFRKMLNMTPGEYRRAGAGALPAQPKCDP